MALAWYNSQKILSEDPCRNLVCFATEAGRIKLVDFEKNRVLWREEPQNAYVLYSIDWSANGILAAGGALK